MSNLRTEDPGDTAARLAAIEEKLDILLGIGGPQGKNVAGAAALARRLGVSRSTLWRKAQKNPAMRERNGQALARGKYNLSAAEDALTFKNSKAAKYWSKPRRK